MAANSPMNKESYTTFIKKYSISAYFPPTKPPGKRNKCELYSGNSQPVVNPSYKAAPMFREPLPSRPIDNEPEYDIEDEEKVYINIDNIDNTPQSATIIDLVLKGEKEDGKENR